MSRNEKRFAVMLLSMIVVLSTFGAAAWYLGYDPITPTGFVVSSSGAVYGDNFGITAIDSTDVNQTKTEAITINNGNGPYDLTASFDTTVLDSDEADGCIINDDTSATASFEGMNVYDGKVITIPSGVSELSVTTTILPHACPLEISSTVSLA